jgi:hypothetical protein
MSLTAITWVVIYSGGLILSVVHPFYPFVSYLVFYYAPPQLNYWGNPLPDLRYSLTASLAMLASAVFLNSSLERVKSERNAASFWLVLFGLNTIIVTIWALNSSPRAVRRVRRGPHRRRELLGVQGLHQSAPEGRPTGGRRRT